MGILDSNQRKTGATIAAWALALMLAMIWNGETGAQGLEKAKGTIRIASFNASLNRAKPGMLLNDMRAGTSRQIRNVAETIRRINPDILLINEFDHDPSGAAAAAFVENYLRDPVIEGPISPLKPVFAAPSNTGLPSGIDLDGNGKLGEPGDAFGFGQFEGQYAMALFSRWPLADDDPARTFQKFLWHDLPGARLPDKKPGSGLGDYYSKQARSIFRLSSKSHWDVPITLPNGQVLHLLASHPTPPVFDGPEDRNGRRNGDEIRFWARYIEGGTSAEALIDDSGTSGGLEPNAAFVVLGDLNNDPIKGDGDGQAILDLIGLAQVQDPTSLNSQDTADFRSGRLRVDYVLPSANLTVVASGVFWPGPDESGFHLIGKNGNATSDHRLVWVDIILD